MALTIEKVQKIAPSNRTKLVTIRISEQAHQWLVAKEVSPTRLFREAMEDIGYTEL